MPKQRDPSIIEKAPDGLDGTPEAAENGAETLRLQALLGDMAARLDAAESENERLRTEVSVERVRARMMEPYANRVYWFVVWYCIVVGLIIFANGLGYVGGAHEPFKLSDMVVGIIAGSTAASVIGLIGIVVSGLFGATRK